MPASTVQNPPAQTESKTAKKKKAKAAAAAAAERTDSPAPAGTPERAGSVSGTNETAENSYIRELKKYAAGAPRLLTQTVETTADQSCQEHPQHQQEDREPRPQQLEYQFEELTTFCQSNASKTQALILENKDKSIDQLIAAKIINADQKRQVDNKPALEAELARCEEQLAQIQKLDDEWRSTANSLKAETEKLFTEKFEKEKADAIAEVKEQAEAELEKAVHDGFLVISQFLRLAAHRRQEASDSDEDGDKAVEGILSSLYGGDSAAVASMVKLYHGTDDTTTGVGGESLSITCAFQVIVHIPC